MKSILLILIVLISPRATSDEHLIPLGESGVFIFEGSRKFVQSFDSSEYSIEALSLVYPSFEPMKLVFVAQFYESEEYFILASNNKKGKLSSNKISIDKNIAECVIEITDNVLNEMRVPQRSKISGTDGTIYMFSSYPYAGYYWGEGKGSKPADLISIYNAFYEQLLNKKESVDLLPIFRSIKGIAKRWKLKCE